METLLSHSQYASAMRLDPSNSGKSAGLKASFGTITSLNIHSTIIFSESLSLNIR